MESIIDGDTNCDYFDKSANDTSHLLKIINTFNLKQIISDIQESQQPQKHVLTTL